MRVFNPARISRSLVTVLVLTLFSSVGLTPNFLNSASAALVTNGTCTVDGTNMFSSDILDSTTVDGTCMVRATQGTISFIVPTGVNTVAALVVGGGGGGGFGGNGGGGGAGAVITSNSGVTATPGTTVTATVGAGGTSGFQPSYTKGGKGTDTSVTINSSTFVASGGGGGSSFNTTADAGGSGGGQAINGFGPGSGFNQDYAGWTERVFSGSAASGVGGGGGGGAGGSPAANSSNGAIGVTIWGYSVGGGGSGWGGGNATVAAPFGGGAPRVGENTDANGGCLNNNISCNGRVNTGGGGGGGGAGGSGVVVIKFVPSRGQGTIAQSNGFQINRASTFTFTRTGTAPTSTTASFQWQVKPSGSSTWSNVTTGTGGTTLTYQTPILSASDNGNTYRIAVTDTQSTHGISTTTFTETSVQSLFTPPGSDTDTALTLNATAQYAILSSSTVLPTAASSPFTLQVWVRPSDAGENDVIFSQGTGSSRFYIKRSGGNLVLYRDGWGATEFTCGAFPSGSWTHISLSWNGTGTANCFVNGSLVSTLTPTVGSVTLNSRAVIGQFSNDLTGATTAFNGQIDELKIWSVVRSAEQIATDMSSYALITDASLIAYYDFNEGPSSSTIYNRKSGATSTTDFATNGTPGWTDVKIVDSVTQPAYTTITFPRSYLTSNNGWKVPETITASVLVVAGGGGGGWNSGGGGGGGGFMSLNRTVITGIVTVTVGAGGAGGQGPDNGGVPTYLPTNGQSSQFGSSTVLGGNKGGVYNNAPLGGSSGGASVTSASGSSGAGGNGSASNGAVAFGGGAGFGSSLLTGSIQYYSAGGGGGGWNSAGGAPGGATAGANGGATASPSQPGNGGGNTTANTGNSASALTGSGGGASATRVNAGNGGSGVVIIRYITAQRPVFTQPTNTTLNVGMTKTFTTNVAQDSTTVNLTRTFRWESSTTGVNGTYSVIKQGTGANNAFFSWVPTDTSTSGSTFAYRVVVTDSDTAGLFIVETSTPVWAIINPTLTMTGRSSISKSIGVSKLETFTVSGGTSTFRYTLTPDSAFFWLDTATATTPRLRIADTATVGTYFETITVIDSVSASVTIPLTIKISPPPTFSANAEQVDSGTVLFLDAGNSASYPRSGTSWNDLSGRNLTTSLQPTAMPATNLGPSSCAAAAFSSEALGSFVFSSTRKTCAYVMGLGLLPTYTVQVWLKRDGTQNDYTAVVATPWPGSGSQINISLHWINGTALQAGVWKGNTWESPLGFATTGAIPNLTWQLATLTFNGTTILLTVNNGVASKFTGTLSGSTAFAANLNLPNLIIGKRFDGDSDYFNGSIGSVRIYNRVLTDAEILQNYNSTIGRFNGTQNKVSISGKYGTTVNETFTVTAGSETLTAAFTANAISGLRWDTSTVRSLKVQLQESLTAGTYSDTVTVTDIYGSTSNFPLTFVVSKADTLTVIIDTPTALSYTGSVANFTPTVRVTGLVSSDTGTAVSTISYKPGGLTCATGGTCAIGDIGPGGGIVFITPSTEGGNGRFFEAAPANWAGVDDVSTASKFCTAATNQDAISRSATQFGIGWGETNTALFEPHCTGGAVKVVSDYAGGGFTNWFIPNTNELTELAKVRNAAGLLGLGSTWSAGRYGYWGSTEGSASTMRTLVSVNNAWSVGGTAKSDSANNMVRPVRMFTPCWAVDTCTSLSTTTKPTDAGTYSITPDGLTLTQGNLSNYQAVRYQSSTVTINQISQISIQIPFYNPIYPETMTINVGGGSGSGALQFTVQSGGTASGCTTDYRKLFTTSVGTCSIQIVKAGDRNYLPETATASIFFIQFIFTQPTPTVGSGPTIALNGENDVTVDLVSAPSITSLSATTISLSAGGSLTIGGTGFGSSPLTVKFWRDKSVTITPASGTSIVVPFTDIAAAGAQSGRIMVITAGGIGVSVDRLTINP
jgi:hypothetical protein